MAAAQKFPATGQTICWDSGGTVIPCAGTGHDGDIQAGATLRYQDNGDGTILDRRTKLTWEKKSADGSIHDMENRYTWDDAFAVHVFTLNNICQNDETLDCSVNGDPDCAGVGGKCGFAGKRDWRVPNIKELQSIVNYQRGNPAVSGAFRTPCLSGATTVLTGSCTPGSANWNSPWSPQYFYWSSTTFAFSRSRPWYVDFFNGDMGASKGRADDYLVRAVRGGL